VGRLVEIRVWSVTKLHEKVQKSKKIQRWLAQETCFLIFRLWATHARQAWITLRE
jgi:hypothetical protein